MMLVNASIGTKNGSRHLRELGEDQNITRRVW